MSNAEAVSEVAGTPEVALGEMHLEVVVVPVGDVDRAKAFYADTLGFRLDADFSGPDGFRIVQVTPPGSGCSVSFGADITTGVPGSVQDLMLVVRDIEATRADLVARGRRRERGVPRRGRGLPPRRHRRRGSRDRRPNGGTYGSFVSFSDPDGNGWIVQEITDRRPGR